MIDSGCHESQTRHDSQSQRSGFNDSLELVMIVWSRNAADGPGADPVEPTTEPDGPQAPWEPDSGHGAQDGPPETSA
jgi:hypothetical protein